MAVQPLEHSISPDMDRNLQVRFSPDVFRTQTYGGVSRYITELHRGLTARGVDSRILAWLHINAYLQGLPGAVGLDISKVRPIRVRQALTKGTDRALERLWCTRQRRDTIWHKSMFDRRVAVGPRLAVTVYDMIHERYPDQFGSRDVIPESKRPWCDAADVVFAISETTRQDLLERFGLPAEKVRVTHLGVSVVEPTPGPLPFSELPWILYVGDRSKPYKNWPRLLDAVRALGSEGRLACFGSPASADDLAAIEARGLTDRVRFIGGDDYDLARTYRAASVLVYPSLFEGFGLPPLEAMAHGCPVVAARAGAVPEVAGDAALLFEPTDPDALSDALTVVLAGGDRIASLRAAGRARAATYTWDRTVAATLDGYRLISS